MQTTKAQIDRFLHEILKNFPHEWRGTTFANSNLLGRKGFAANLDALLVSKAKNDATEITTDELVALGNAEDYLRVATNLSTLYEIVLAIDADLPIEQVLSFGSTKMGIVATALTTNKHVKVYSGTTDPAFTPEQLKTLNTLSLNISCTKGSPPVTTDNSNTDSNDCIVLVDDSVPVSNRVGVDGVLSPYILKIINPDALQPSAIFTIRKRLSTPATTPMIETFLQCRAGAEVTANTTPPPKDAVDEFHKHLQTLSGTAPNLAAPPVVTTAGLSAVSAFYTALIARGGADILMSSTAYGGCSQLTDILSKQVPTFHKHTFDIQGHSVDIGRRIQQKLEELASDVSKLSPRTVLFVEIPTNPDMKVPNIADVAAALATFKARTGKQAMLLVDTTFAPNSNVMAQARAVSDELTVMVFSSLSKSVSRGLTTGGAIVSNHTDDGMSLVLDVAKMADMYDTTSKPDQLAVLSKNHFGVEDRCKKSYDIARESGKVLVEAVRNTVSKDMPLAFMSEENAAKGFTSSTFSFNLPSPPNATADINAALAQRFVDLLCMHPEFKPCVSFGQDNGLVYCTVPATSTQGAIADADKAKQAVGGVQLTRLSFPPTTNVERVHSVLREAVAKIYE